ncbi:MAG: XF1762 family protein [Candidatus Korobacteraceae bacterium]
MSINYTGAIEGVTCVEDLFKTKMEVRPLTFKAACQFVKALHRHNKPPVGHKFSIGLYRGETLVGVGMVSRPVARYFDNGVTLEVSRTCTDGTMNANSMLYGALWRAGKAMGYRRIITYTQEGESGASLKAAGFVKVKDLPTRGSWAESSVKLKDKKDPIGNGGVERALWEIRSQSDASGETKS